MRRARRERGRRVASVAVLVVAAACTTTSGEPADDADAAAAVAAEFVAAWNDGRTTTMASLLRRESLAEWDSVRLQQTIARIRNRGDIRSTEVVLDGDAAALGEGDEATATVPYVISYRSDAARRLLELEGELDLSRAPEGEWEIVWDGDELIPGIDGARGLVASYRYLKRGAILDRRGRKLATGTGAARRYPHGALAGDTVGHVEPDADGLLVGGSGLEAGLNDELAGTATSKLEVVNARGKVIDVVGRRRGERGEDVRTTLDLRVQRAAQAAYGGTDGGAVVMDPRTGDLLALVSSSSFDPNGYVGASVEPFSRAVEGLYPPGSAMKVVTAAAALDTGTVTPTTQLTGPGEFQGVRNFESGEFGRLSFATATQYSVNTAFAQVALKLGAKKMTRYAEAFGFNRRPKAQLDDVATSSFPFPEDTSDLMWGSIGQAQVVATPMHMASVAATIGNGGERMEPRIVLEQALEGKRVVSTKTARTLTELMENVVVGGTGQAARTAGLDIAGKTGTAEVEVGGEIKNHAWFICFAPAKDPRVAVAVVSEYGGIGGQVAAPIARSILVGALPFVK